MKIYKCDRCEQELPINKKPHYLIIKESYGFFIHDVKYQFCDNCYTQLRKFMNIENPCQKGITIGVHNE